MRGGGRQRVSDWVNVMSQVTGGETEVTADCLGHFNVADNHWKNGFSDIYSQKEHVLSKIRLNKHYTDIKLKT